LYLWIFQILFVCLGHEMATTLVVLRPSVVLKTELFSEPKKMYNLNLEFVFLLLMFLYVGFGRLVIVT
jgi:hypothetical protein